MNDGVLRGFPIKINKKFPSLQWLTANVVFFFSPCELFVYCGIKPENCLFFFFLCWHHWISAHKMFLKIWFFFTKHLRAVQFNHISVFVTGLQSTPGDSVTCLNAPYMSVEWNLQILSQLRAHFNRVDPADLSSL